MLCLEGRLAPEFLKGSWIPGKFPEAGLYSSESCWVSDRVAVFRSGFQRRIHSSSAWSGFMSHVSGMRNRSAVDPTGQGLTRVLSWSLTSAGTLHFSRMRISWRHITEVAAALGWLWWPLTALPQQPLVWNIYQPGAVTVSVHQNMFILLQLNEFEWIPPMLISLFLLSAAFVTMTENCSKVCGQT